MQNDELAKFLDDRTAALRAISDAVTAEVAAVAEARFALTVPVDPVPVDPPPVDPVPVDPPTPTVPATPIPVPSNAPAGARTQGRDVAGCKLPGVSVTSTAVTITSALPDFSDWHIGSRRLVFAAWVDRWSDIKSIDGVSGSLPLIQCLGGGGFGVAEHITALGCTGSMIFKQESGGVAKEFRKWDMLGMSQDALKVGGGNLIEGCRIGEATYRGGAPHADAFTVMASKGGVTIRDNDVDWRYANRPDQSGINNLGRIETYAAAGNEWDDIVIEDNRFRHANDRSFGMQVVMKGTPIWRGSIKVRRNIFDKAGGVKKILYAPSQHISEWTGNTDASGADIPISAA